MKSKRDNIAEYILYLWQLEDYLRAFPEQANDNAELDEILRMMHEEGVMNGGHIQMAQIALSEMEDLHDELLASEAPYRAVMQHLSPQLNLLKAKTDRPTMSDVEACLTLLYQVMMLRLQKKDISPETADVQQRATQVLQFLSKTYKQNANS